MQSFLRAQLQRMILRTVVDDDIIKIRRVLLNILHRLFDILFFIIRRYHDKTLHRLSPTKRSLREIPLLRTSCSDYHHSEQPLPRLSALTATDKTLLRRLPYTNCRSTRSVLHTSVTHAKRIPFSLSARCPSFSDSRYADSP